METPLDRAIFAEFQIYTCLPNFPYRIHKFIYDCGSPSGGGPSAPYAHKILRLYSLPFKGPSSKKEIVPPYLCLVFDGRLDCAVSGIVAGPDLLIVTPFEDQ